MAVVAVPEVQADELRDEVEVEEPVVVVAQGLARDLGKHGERVTKTLFDAV